MFDGTPMPIPRTLYLARIDIAERISAIADSVNPVDLRLTLIESSNWEMVTDWLPVVIVELRFTFKPTFDPLNKFTAIK